MNNNPTKLRCLPTLLLCFFFYLPHPANANEGEKAIALESQNKKEQLLQLYNNQQTDDFNRALDPALDFMKENGQWEDFFFCWALKIDMYIFDHNYDEALGESGKMYEFANRQKIPYGIASALIAMGSAYSGMDKLDDSAEVLRQAIDLLKGDGSRSTQALAYDAYIQLIQTELDRLGFGEAETRLSELESLINKINEQSDSEKNNTRLFNLYALYYLLYYDTGRLDEAETCIQRMEPLSNSLLTHRQLLRRKIWLHEARQEYAQALEIIDTLEESYLATGDNTLSILYLLEDKIRIAEANGDLRQALDTYRRHRTTNDTLQRVEMSERLDELRTRYEVDRHIEEKQKSRNNMLFALAGCAMLLIIIAGGIHYSYKLRRKNLSLVRRIREQEHLEEQLEQQRDEWEKICLLLQARQVDSQEDGQVPALPGNGIFVRLQQLMKEQKLYTKPEINRRDLSQELGTNESYLREAIRKELNCTFKEYINELRLTHARKLLAMPLQTYTIEAIAQEAGFGSRVTMHRLFRNKYGLSPDEFRKLANI